MGAIKSIGPVNTSVGWAVRVRFIGRTERYVVAPEHRYALDEAMAAADSLRRDIHNHGEEIAVERTELLPLGVTLTRSAVGRRNLRYSAYTSQSDGSTFDVRCSVAHAERLATEYARSAPRDQGQEIQMTNHPNRSRARRYVNGVRVKRTQIFASAGFWRWKIVDEHEAEFVDGGNYLTPEQAEIGLASALDSMRTKIEIACDTHEDVEFCAWLNANGYDATVGKSTGNYVDGRCTASDLDADETMRALWEQYCDA